VPVREPVAEQPLPAAVDEHLPAAEPLLELPLLEAIELPELDLSTALTDRVPDLPLAADLDLSPPAAVAVPAPEAPAFELDLADEPEIDIQGLQPETAPSPAPAAETSSIALPDLAEVVEVDFGEFDLVAPPPTLTVPDVDLQPLSFGEVTQPFERLPEDVTPVADAGVDDALTLDLGAFEDEAAQAAAVAEAPSPAEELLTLPLAPAPAPLPDLPDLSEPVLSLAVDDAVPDAANDSAADDDEQVKVIGSLRIPIPLFNIYLNEADELSRRLCTDLAEWSLEHDRRPVSENSAVLAHSLAGSSATVGYGELSALARALEHVLIRSAAAGPGQAGEPELFNEAADEIRRLLHQFAAGFLKPMTPGLLDRLAAHERWLAEQAVTHADQQPTPPAGVEERLEAEASEPAPAEERTVAWPPAAEAPAQPPAEPEPEPEPEPGPDFTLDGVEPQPPAEPGDSSLMPLAAVAPVVASFGALEALPDEPVPARAPRTDAFDDDEDIEAVDAIDDDLFPIFEEEAEELLPQLQSRLRDWALHPSDTDAPSACMRTLHTFKGGSRLSGAMRLGEMAHRLETAVEHLAATPGLEPSQVEPLLARADHGGRLRGAAQVQAAASATPAAPVVPPPAVQPVPVELPSAEPVTEPGPRCRAGRTSAGARAGQRRPAGQSGRLVALQQPRQAFAVPAADRAGGGTAVRVRAGLLDRLVNHAGEVSITRARIDADVRQLQGAVNDLTDNLDRLRSQLRDIELQAETQIASRIEAAKAASQSFDPLEMDRFTRFQELTRMMAESVNDVATVQRSVQRTLQSTEDELAAQARLTRELQDDLLRTRMVEFESLADRLYRVVRQAAKDSGKQVRLDIVGGSIEVDRGVLERMIGPFEHLLRNSVAHGIETPAQRQAAGKDGRRRDPHHRHAGRQRVGVDCRDDGAGLDLARIRQRALERGLIAARPGRQRRRTGQPDLPPGFSTAAEVTELAGRGVGLDVVRAEVNAMGGRIETASTPGQGTRFKLVLPLTTAVTQVVMLRCGELQVAVPSTLIEVVRRVPTAEVEQAYASGG
jgi:chemosensory pili system protein ChpA (sensor histidine kinase/response regulator)